MSNIENIVNTESGVVAARAAVACAEREHAEARARLEAAGRDVEAAERIFDADPSAELGQAVLAARSARDLAQLRLTRASKRLEEGRAALEGAERAARVAQLEEERRAAAARVAQAAAAAKETAEALVSAHFHPPLAAALRFVRERAAQAGRCHESAAAELAEARAALVNVESELGDIAAERREELTRAREARAEVEREELAKAASIDAFRTGNSALG